MEIQLQLVRLSLLLGGLLPGNKVISRLHLNKGESIQLISAYSLVYACETAYNGSRALFSTGWGAIDKWNGNDEWVTFDKPDKFCFFKLDGNHSTFVLKNNLIDTGVFDVYIL